MAKYLITRLLAFMALCVIVTAPAVSVPQTNTTKHSSLVYVIPDVLPALCQNDVKSELQLPELIGRTDLLYSLLGMTQLRQLVFAKSLDFKPSRVNPFRSGPSPPAII